MWFKTAVVLLALMVPLVVLLQVQGAHQAAEVDKERRLRQLEYAADQMAFEIGGDLARAGAPLRFREFIPNSPTPRFIRNLYVVSRQAAAPSLDRWNPEEDALEPASWPPQLEALRTQTDPLGEASLPPGYLLVPAGPGPGPGPQLIVAELDLDYLRKTYFPGLKGKYFPSGEDGGFRVQIADLPRAEVFWDTAGTGTPLLAPAEVVRPVMGFGGPPRQFVERMGGSPALRFNGRGPLRARQGWELRVRHSWGSLDTVVESSFRRDLVIRLSIVGLASVALLSLLWTAYREKQLAARQMDFVAGVSHELRTPLAVICSAGENLADGVALKQGKVEQYGSLVRDEGRRLSEMVEQILAFSKTEGAPEREPVELGKLVQKAMTACSHEIRISGADVDLYIPADLPPVVVDPTPVAYAIRNLLSNAIRHGKSPIYMTAHPAPQGVDLSVEDQGEGIDPREARLLFEPFYRGQTARATQVRGLGLGLSLVKRIVESQGGRVRAENRQGGGARFVLTLPT